MQIRQISRVHELDLLTAARSMNAFSWPGTDFGARQWRLQGESNGCRIVAFRSAKGSAFAERKATN
jgi:hypothetical protein